MSFFYACVIFFLFIVFPPCTYRLERDVQSGLYYTSHDASPASSSPYKTVPRRQAELHNVAQTLAMTRNAYSSSQLGYRNMKFVT